MIREDRFTLSRRPYAVDLASLRQVHQVNDEKSLMRLNAVWFRGTKSRPTAHFGYLWGYQVRTNDPLEFLDRHSDGRYGGECLARWDGQRYWGAQELEEMELYLRVLRPMLENYPMIPNGYDGWWRF